VSAERIERAPQPAPVTARWISAEAGPAAGRESGQGRTGATEREAEGYTTQSAARGEIRSEAPENLVVLAEGDTEALSPYTILFVGNPALEAPWHSGTFVRDPVLDDETAYDECVARSVAALFGSWPGLGEQLLVDAGLADRIRVLSLFETDTAVDSAGALIAQDGVSNLLIGRRESLPDLIARVGVSVDVVFGVSMSSTHNRASAWFTTDDDSGPGTPFVLDGVVRSHRHQALTPGMAVVHVSSDAMTVLHEFGHATSSYTNGSVVDLYVDSVPALNNRRGRPIPGTFASYQAEVVKSDPTRASIGYPAGWQSYHSQLDAAPYPALMDNYYLSPTIPEDCLHDRITRRFLTDRLLAKSFR
jgi:hypothetical protein